MELFSARLYFICLKQACQVQPSYAEVFSARLVSTQRLR